MVGRSTPLLPGGGAKPGAAMRQRGRRLRSNLVGERGVCVLLLLGIAALTSSAAMSYFLPHLLAWRRASRCLPTVGALITMPTGSVAPAAGRRRRRGQAHVRHAPRGLGAQSGKFFYFYFPSF